MRRRRQRRNRNPLLKRAKRQARRSWRKKKNACLKEMKEKARRKTRTRPKRRLGSSWPRPNKKHGWARIVTTRIPRCVLRGSRFGLLWLRMSGHRNWAFRSQLLSRVFRILRENNPELMGEKRKYTIPPPNVQREGSKKTLFANIVEICQRMKRSPEHVIQYLFAELGTTGSVAGAGQLIIRGRFQQKGIENVLKRYIGRCKCPVWQVDS